MKTRTLRTALLLALTVIAWLSSLGQKTSVHQTHPPGGMFSRNATEIWGRAGARSTLVIKSPDRRFALVVEYPPKGGRSAENITAYLEGEGKRFRTDIGQLVNSEVLWSPDSKALAVTFSDGGDVGTYHTEIYWVEKLPFRVTEPTARVKKAYLSQKLVCFRPEPPNIGAIEWLGGSQKILLAAEIPPHSNCDDFGTFKAFEVLLPEGKILKVYGQIEAKRLFGQHLGAELAKANDQCFTKPGSCQIPQLHRLRSKSTSH